MRSNLLLTLIVFGVSALGLAAEELPSASALRPGDILSVSVFRVEEFSRTVRVEEDGTFRFPFCGEIHAEGKTPRQVSRELEKLLAAQVSNPQVDIYVQAWSSRPVYILGQVKSCMSLELPTYGCMTALQAISTAGGFTESADLTNVAVLRRDKKTQTLKRLSVDVTALASQTSGGDNFILQPEDTLIIPKASPVYVSGLVAAPGIYNIDTQNPPLCSELIIRVGGLSVGADETKVYVVRSEGKGTVLKTVSMRRQSNGVAESDLRIQPGDSVYVPTAEQICVLGQVNTPGALTLRPEERVTAARAIMMAGGFKATAKEGDVLLIRNGEIISLNLKRMYEDPDQMKNDQELQAGDIVFVRESFW